MENCHNRVMAYVLAKPIEPEMQENISGGNGGMKLQFCHRETVKASGMSRNNMDVAIDASLDC
jgi:hypothetical protein